MKRVVAALVVAALLAAPFSVPPSPAQAQAPQCVEIAAMERVFSDMGIRLFREMSLEWGGVPAQAQLWVAPSGDWGLILIGNGRGCMLMSGSDFRLPSGSL